MLEVSMSSLKEEENRPGSFPTSFARFGIPVYLSSLTRKARVRLLQKDFGYIRWVGRGWGVGWGGGRFITVFIRRLAPLEPSILDAGLYDPLIKVSIWCFRLDRLDRAS